jgi:hypothetical protein
MQTGVGVACAGTNTASDEQQTPFDLASQQRFGDQPRVHGVALALDALLQLGDAHTSSVVFDDIHGATHLGFHRVRRGEA